MDIQKIKYTKLYLQKNEIQKINPIFRKRFIMLTSISRDITILSKLMCYVDNNKDEEEVLKHANKMCSLFFLTTFISKIYEMWIFLDKNHILDELSKKADISSELKQNIDAINSFFGDVRKRRIFAFIRDKFSFHYEYRNDIDEVIKTSFDKFGDNDFQMYLTEHDSANDVFPSLDAVILMSIFQEMQEIGFTNLDDKQKLEILFSFVRDVSKLAMEFISEYLTEAFPVKWEQKEEEIEIEVPEISTVELPIIAVKKK